jgi:hypothetical protein
MYKSPMKSPPGIEIVDMSKSPVKSNIANASPLKKGDDANLMKLK